MVNVPCVEFVCFSSQQPLFGRRPENYINKVLEMFEPASDIQFYRMHLIAFDLSRIIIVYSCHYVKLYGFVKLMVIGIIFEFTCFETLHTNLNFVSVCDKSSICPNRWAAVIEVPIYMHTCT